MAKREEKLEANAPSTVVGERPPSLANVCTAQSFGRRELIAMTYRVMYSGNRSSALSLIYLRNRKFSMNLASCFSRREGSSSSSVTNGILSSFILASNALCSFNEAATCVIAINLETIFPILGRLKKIRFAGGDTMMMPAINQGVNSTPIKKLQLIVIDVAIKKFRVLLHELILKPSKPLPIEQELFLGIRNVAMTQHFAGDFMVYLGFRIALGHCVTAT